MFPDGWKVITLGEACGGNLQTGPFGSQLHAEEYSEAGIPVVMPKDISDFQVKVSSAARIPKSKAEDLKRHMLEEGDIIFSRRGDVSKLALVGRDAAGSLCGTGCLKAKPSSRHSAVFISFFLQKDSSRRWLESNAVGQTMPNMNTAILSELPILSAGSYEEEEKIARILSTWDEAITTTERLVVATQLQKSAMMQQLLTGRRRLPGFEIKAGVRQERYGCIPNDWKFSSIGEVADQVVVRNLAAKNIPVLSCSKHDGFVDSLSYFNKKVYSDDLSGYKVIRKGEFGFPANHIEEGSIGHQTRYEEGLVSPIYVVFSIDERLVHGEFLYALLKTDHYRQIFASTTNASVDRRGSLRWKEFSSIKISLPSLEEQKSISSVINVADNEIAALQMKLDCLRQEKKALMQQLLTGKRRVKVPEEAVA